MDLDILKYYAIDLQFFASPESEGRTEQPSPRRRKEKREEGEVPKSMELNAAFVFMATLLTFLLVFNFLVKDIISMMKHYLTDLNHNMLKSSYSEYLMFNRFFWKGVGVILLVASLAAIFINIVQAGFLITLKAISPKASRISFTLKKIREKILFSKAVMMGLFFALIKIFLLLGIFILIISFNIRVLLNFTGVNLEVAVNQLLTILEEVFLSGGSLLLLIGVFEYFFKKKQFEDSLKVTRFEAKREMKQEEGDPRLKGHLKDMYNKLIQQQSIKQRIPDADVIITNPTHFAVALKYDMDSMTSPMVVAKGEDELALLIREIAKESSVEIIENPPLARELYKILKVGDFIPEHLTMIIAEIFVQLYQDGKWKMQENISEKQA